MSQDVPKCALQTHRCPNRLVFGDEIEITTNKSTTCAYDAWSINNAFMGPILFGSLGLLTN